MKYKLAIVILLVALGLNVPAALVPVQLRCEYRANPLGLDEPLPRFSWAATAKERAQKQSAYQVLVASSLALLKQNQGDLWDSGKVTGDQSTQVTYAGKPLAARQKYHWKVMLWDRADKASEWSAPAFWTMGLLQPADWSAEFISVRDNSPVHADRQNLLLPPARQYRKEFNAAKPVRRATIYATALGIYELQLNGQRVGEAFFAPGWTDYRQRVYYQAYDVTALVQNGPNAVGAIVADGWYAGYVGYGLLVGYGPNQTGRNIYGKTPALLAQLEVEYADGTLETVATDPTWKVTSEGPFREADLLMGERYDARQEMPGWSKPGFDDHQWVPAIRAGDNGSVKATFYESADSGKAKRQREVELGFIKPAKVEAYPTDPVRLIEEIKPLTVTARTNGVYIFNLGQNFAGTVRLKVKGKTGTEIKLRYGEMVHPDGRLMTENLRKARATDYYILKGDSKGEVYMPRFTSHGFQYVEVTGYPGKPKLDAITGLVLHSDTPLTSQFECSDPMANRLFKNIVWTQRANFVELPTDCPQRDEREGWMGDAQIYVRAATYNADVAAFYSKWLREVREAQLPSGAYPDYCPWPFQHGKAYAAAWTDAGIIVPYTLWKVYGDKRIIERQWDSMVKFMDWRQRVSPDRKGYQQPDANTWGDWLNLNEKTPIEFIDAAYFKWDADLMAQMAQALGKQKEYDDYYRLQVEVAAQFSRDYHDYNVPGGMKINTQTAYALAIMFGLRPSMSYEAAARLLAERVAQNGHRMATGFLGTKPLLPALSAHGQHDLAVRLFQSRKYPSWGYEVENGATSIWERWDSFTKEHGFNGAGGNQNAAMNSFSHYSFGAVCEWMFQSLAGIDTDGVGFRKILIRPLPPTPGSNPDQTPINWVRAHYDSQHGRIATDWKNTREQFELRVTIPVNTTATVHIPAASAADVTESRQPLDKAEGVQVRGQEGNVVLLEIGSGTYNFVAKGKR
ncbi:MAG: family 78 glycoside hydrolase catalytic domain [Verrucomicrobiota bacterium]